MGFTKLFWVAALLSTLSYGSAWAQAIPQEAWNSLSVSGEAVLYSLEPREEQKDPERSIYGRLILGKTKLAPKAADKAKAAIRGAITNWNGWVATCFEPSHALDVSFKGHIYRFVVCYTCQNLHVYRDGKLMAGTGITGTPDAFDELLRAADVPLSDYYADHQKRAAADKLRNEANIKRWFDGMPASIQSFGLENIEGRPEQDRTAMRAALAKQFPNQRARIQSLFGWFGSGEGPWSGFPSYESEAETLLLEYSTSDLLASLENDELTQTQWEGAARFFAGWAFNKQRKEQNVLPPAIRLRLLGVSLATQNEDRNERAKKAFGDNGQ